MADRCGFCGSTDGPFTHIEGMFTVLMCPSCLARRSHGRGPYPEMSNTEMRAGLDLLPTWVLQQKVGPLTVLAAVEAAVVTNSAAVCTGAHRVDGRVSVRCKRPTQPWQLPACLDATRADARVWVGRRHPG